MYSKINFGYGCCSQLQLQLCESISRSKHQTSTGKKQANSLEFFKLTDFSQFMQINTIQSSSLFFLFVCLISKTLTIIANVLLIHRDTHIH